MLEAQDAVETLKKSVELAHENYDIVSTRYSNDMALVTDLLDAATQRLDAELQLVNARINVLFNYYKLCETAGIL
jgi:outer membrane protein TolC